MAARRNGYTGAGTFLHPQQALLGIFQQEDGAGSLLMAAQPYQSNATTRSRHFPTLGGLSILAAFLSAKLPGKFCSPKKSVCGMQDFPDFFTDRTAARMERGCEASRKAHTLALVPGEKALVPGEKALVPGEKE